MSNKTMSSWLNKLSFNEKDEYYTPRILVEPIIKYLPQNSVIWCPFDTENSEFVICFKEHGYKVIHSHIWNGQDFFEYEPNDHYDYIISNPPFTKKLAVFERLYKLNKPFAMICGLPILNYQEIGNFFVDKDLQLLIVDKKVSFDGNTASFNNSYFCRNILPKDLIFEHLEHNNSKKYFVPSKMYDEYKERKNVYGK
ncbi:MAG: tRNA (adenine-N(6)-)-methyltransferase [Bacilli bacterium]|nr:tRNA (adenine-N(6)-)-methyltransferase [Bacilli bacterium]